MENTNQAKDNSEKIDKVIDYLQSLKEDNAVIDSVDVEYGYKYSESIDTNYSRYREAKTLDGNFYIRIHGFKPIKKDAET